jgi:Mannosylglycerate hydrolase MGH1-like glycoside hydrolase domain
MTRPAHVRFYVIALAVGLYLATSLSATTKPPKLQTNASQIDRAFSIALSDIAGNIHSYRGGLLEQSAPVLMAGAGYNSPWTRDAAINTWNGAGLLWPSVARNTLLSVLKRRQGKLFIGGQYWDAIVWATGAWNYYLYTGDRPFLQIAFEATQNTLAARGADEFDPSQGLFRGPAVYGDGVAAYPDRYAQHNGGSSAIADWPKNNPDRVSHPGFGLPMFALSTNCAYLDAFELLARMAEVLDRHADPAWTAKAANLRAAINRTFWKPELGRYATLVDRWGMDDRQEAIGLAFVVLFDIADPAKRESIFRHVQLTSAGIPCLWPTYQRYARLGGFGRHSGTVWPHAEAFWADAAARAGHSDLFAYDLTRMAAKAVRDGQFYELYNPITGEPYGGLQEAGNRGIILWDSQPHQTWSATGYLRLVLFDLAGMRFDERGILFAPVLPDDLHQLDLTTIPYRGVTVDIHIRGSGSRILDMTVNGRPARDHRLPATATGRALVAIDLAR